MGGNAGIGGTPRGAALGLGAGAAEGLGVVVEPRRAIQRHEFVVLMGEAFDFEIGVVDAGGEEGGVEIADGREMPAARRK